MQDYEKSQENFVLSLSLLYAGRVIGKVKYEQGRSALVMKHTGKSTKKRDPFEAVDHIWFWDTHSKTTCLQGINAQHCRN